MARPARPRAGLLLALVTAGSSLHACGAPDTGQLAITRDESGLLVVHAQVCESGLELDRIVVSIPSRTDEEVLRQVDLPEPLPKGISTTAVEGDAACPTLTFDSVPTGEKVRFYADSSTVSDGFIAGPEATLRRIDRLEPGLLLVSEYDDDGAVGVSVVEMSLDEWRDGVC